MKDYTIGIDVMATGIDDPDAVFYEHYACGSAANPDGYCNPEIDKPIDQQSASSDSQQRRQIVWEIERKLQQDGARPIIFYPRGATCWQPYLKGLAVMINSSFNGWRFEDIWLDK
jgi:peptide/nickel transport system substrate-binding protein